VTDRVRHVWHWWWREWRWWSSIVVPLVVVPLLSWSGQQMGTAWPPISALGWQVSVWWARTVNQLPSLLWYDQLPYVLLGAFLAVVTRTALGYVGEASVRRRSAGGTTGTAEPRPIPPDTTLANLGPEAWACWREWRITTPEDGQWSSFIRHARARGVTVPDTTGRAMTTEEVDAFAAGR
jgi:hypothetical protein